jgi:hypothetical protein
MADFHAGRINKTELAAAIHLWQRATGYNPEQKIYIPYASQQFSGIYFAKKDIFYHYEIINIPNGI